MKPPLLVAVLAASMFAGSVVSSNAGGAGPGTLDRSFSGDGRKLSDFFGGRDSSRAVMTSGKGILVAGEAREHGENGRPIIVRYRTSGRIDKQFAHAGRRVLHVRRGRVDALARTKGGKIVAAGNNGNFFVARLNGDGSFDRSFGKRGVVRTTILPGYDRSTAVAVQDDGKIVVAGYLEDINAGKDRLLIVRYRRSGKLDRSFDDDGKLVTDFGTGTYVRGRGLALQPDGKIVVSGTVGNNWIVARFLEDGSPDPSFDEDGIRYTAPLLIGEAFDVAIQPNGKIVTAGSEYGGPGVGFGVGRYLPNGTPDPSFGEGGAVRTTFPTRYPSGNIAGFETYGEALAMQPNGRIVVSGTAFLRSSRAHFAVARYRRDGGLDRSFSGNGKQVVKMRPRATNNMLRDWSHDVALAADGAIVLVGWSRAGQADADFAVARLRG